MAEPEQQHTTPDPEVWISDPLPGGYVCAAPNPELPDGICGMPVESEPCPIHSTRTAW